jgi:hypothetical protein
MAHKTTTIPNPVLDRMHYDNPPQIVDWKKLFSGGTSQKVKPARRKVRKVPAKAAGLKPETKPEAKTLVFIKKEPITFQLKRLNNPDDFERMAFVIRACSKDPKQKPFMVLHVEQTRTGSRLVATDGRRLHVAETALKIQGGDYNPIIAKDYIRLGEPVTGIMFPNWAKVIPTDARKRGVINLADAGWGKSQDQTEQLTRAFNLFVRMTGCLINLRYLEDLTKKEWSVYCQNEKNRAIMLKEEGAKMSIFAIITPFAESSAKAA